MRFLSNFQQNVHVLFDGFSTQPGEPDLEDKNFVTDSRNNLAERLQGGQAAGGSRTTEIGIVKTMRILGEKIGGVDVVAVRMASDQRTGPAYRGHRLSPELLF